MRSELTRAERRWHDHGFRTWAAPCTMKAARGKKNGLVKAVELEGLRGIRRGSRPFMSAAQTVYGTVANDLGQA